MKRIYRKTIHDSSWKEITSPVVGCWQFYVAPTTDELAEVSRITKVPLDAIRESFDDPFEFPRIERENGTVMLVFRVPTREHGTLTTEPAVFIITDSAIISLIRAEHQFTNQLLNDQHLVSTQKTNFILQVLLQVIRRYEHYLREINKNVLGKKASIARLSDADILLLVEVEETLTNFNSALVPLIGVLHTISQGKVIQLFDNDRELVEELTNSGHQILEWCKLNIKSAANIREAHSTILTNSLNRTIKFLTSMTIIVTIPNILAGLFGMNVSLPLQNSSHAFLFVLGWIVLFVTLSLGIFWRKKWL